MSAGPWYTLVLWCNMAQFRADKSTRYPQVALAEGRLLARALRRRGFRRVEVRVICHATRQHAYGIPSIPLEDVIKPEIR